MSERALRIDPASDDDGRALENLLQLYQYDFSEFAGGVPDADGVFRYIKRRPQDRAFLLRVRDADPESGEEDWRLAGFSIVANHTWFGEKPEPDQWAIDEFFVMRKYRRTGCGRTLARYCWDRFRGRWEVAEMAVNVNAQAFWRRIIGEYTDGAFEDVFLEDPRWHGPVQRFDNSRR